MRLASIYNLNFEMRIFLFYAPGCFFCLLLGDALAKIECDYFVAVNIHALQGLSYNIIHILTGNYEISIDKANQITFTNSYAANVNCANSCSDFRRLDMC